MAPSQGPAPDAGAGARSVTLHSAWWGIVGSLVGAACFVGVAIVIVVAHGVGPLSLAVLAAALGAASVVLLDMPVATTFDGEGFTRRAPLRRRRVDWSDVAELARVTRRSAVRLGSSREVGLVAAVGRRRLLLCDRTEGSIEHRRLREVIGDAVPADQLDALGEPPPDRTPTWVGRRPRWRP